MSGQQPAARTIDLATLEKLAEKHGVNSREFSTEMLSGFVEEAIALARQAEPTATIYVYEASIAADPVIEAINLPPGRHILYAEQPSKSPAPMNDDAQRLDWLNENFFSDQKDEWDERQAPDSIKWKFFGPMSVQGDIRRVIDAARLVPTTKG